MYGLPKFHITNCSKIQEERKANRFTGRYFWHNSNVVSIEDKTTGEILEIKFSYYVAIAGRKPALVIATTQLSFTDSLTDRKLKIPQEKFNSTFLEDRPTGMR